MRLLLDEMFSPAIARELRSRGHDVEALKGHSAWERLPDPDVFALARAERRALVTENLDDFRVLHAHAVRIGEVGHYGLVLLPGGARRRRSETGRLIAALEAKLAEHPGDGDLMNAETWL